MLLSVFTVTDLGDTGTGSGDQGDLRYCITQANANEKSSNQIQFQPGLTGTIVLTQGSLDITKDLQIDGPGQNLLTISGNHKSGVFDITDDPGVQNVSFFDLTIADGTRIMSPLGVEGGGLFNDHAAVTLTRVTVTGNSVPDQGQGGGIFNGSGTVTLVSSTVADNHVGNQGAGGGIFNDTKGTLIIQEGTISQNTGTGSLAAGVMNHGVMTLTSSSVLANGNLSFSPFDHVGGIANYGGKLFVDHSTISHNRGTNINLGDTGAAGIDSDGEMTIQDSTFVDNGGPVGAAAVQQRGDSLATVRGSTFSTNSEGIDDFGHMEVTNSTFVNNSLGVRLGPIPTLTMTMMNCTIAGAGTGIQAAARHPGVFALGNTIVDGGNGVLGRLTVFGQVVSLGYNLIAQGNFSVGWVATDQVGTRQAPIDLRLGTLRDNGGPTQTVSPLPDSPAIGTGDPEQLGSLDQRGAPREAPTVGALAANPAAAFRVLAPDQVAPGQRFTFTVTAVDDAGFVATTYVGTVHFDSSDPDAQVPADQAFRATDAGARSFTATLQNTGEQTLLAADTANPDLMGSATITVVDGAASGRSLLEATDVFFSQTDDFGRKGVRTLFGRLFGRETNWLGSALAKAEKGPDTFSAIFG
jgi:hypothetical protein